MKNGFARLAVLSAALCSSSAAIAASNLTMGSRPAPDPNERSPLKPESAEFMDLNKNGKKDPYEDPSAPIEQRIKDLLAQMNVDEKTCQLATLYGFQRVLLDDLPKPDWKEKIWKDGIARFAPIAASRARGTHHRRTLCPQ